MGPSSISTSTRQPPNARETKVASIPGPPAWNRTQRFPTITYWSGRPSGLVTAVIVAESIVRDDASINASGITEASRLSQVGPENGRSLGTFPAGTAD